MNSNKPLVVITTGDPAGIGPEITKKALKNTSLRKKANFIILGSENTSVKIGSPSKISGRISFENIKKAVKLLEAISGRKALVTAPISKYSFMKAGVPYKGHTELLAKLTNTKDIAMMFSADDFKLALVTRHIALAKVPRSLTTKRIVDTTRLFFSTLRDRFRIKDPRIGIAGLNPHAGENGVLGNEEARVIIPAIKKLRPFIRNITGPWPADILFRLLYKKKLDGVVCMYHDQGLVPFKMLYFEKGVNITLGLPFIRTSPDHGTAYDIAGKGLADPSSMQNAIKLAVELV